jgi:hypothetical protein
VLKHVLNHLKQLLTLDFQWLLQGFACWEQPLHTPLLLATAADVFRSKPQLVAENALLRQQLMILHRHIKRPVYGKTDRLLLVLLASMVRAWKQALFLVQPETVLRWHREGFRFFWKQKSRVPSHTPKVAPEIIFLIKTMAKNNRLWGTQSIQAHPRCVAQAGSSRVSTNHPEIHAASAHHETERTVLGDIAAQSCKRRVGLRLLARHSSLLPLAVCLLHHRTGVPKSDPCRRHAISYRCMGRATAARGDTVWAHPPIPQSR